MKESLKHLEKRGNGEQTIKIKSMIEEEINKRKDKEKTFKRKEIFCYDEIERGIYDDKIYFYQDILETINYHLDEGKEVILFCVVVDQKQIQELLQFVRFQRIIIWSMKRIKKFLDRSFH